MSKTLPRYPIYVPSKGRYESALTAKCLIRDGVPFSMVVEEQEVDKYAAVVGRERLIVLPFRDKGLTASRNWIKEHATSLGFKRHWQLDDNIRRFGRIYKGTRTPCRAGVALAVCEDFTDRYENIAVSGLTYRFFAIPEQMRVPFYLNVHVYSISLIDNAIPFKWRPIYNDDTDLCLQVLSAGYCTVLVNAFFADKAATMTVSGGNTPIYQRDGRLRMARSLSRDWPRVVSVQRRFQRPQHVVRGAWRGFDTPLKLRSDIVVPDTPNEYGMTLTVEKKS